MHMHIVIIWLTGAASVCLPASTSEGLREYFLLNFKPPPPLWHPPAGSGGCVSHFFSSPHPPEQTRVFPSSDYGSNALLDTFFVGQFLSEQSSKLVNSHHHLGSKAITSISPLLSDVET